MGYVQYWDIIVWFITINRENVVRKKKSSRRAYLLNQIICITRILTLVNQHFLPYLGSRCHLFIYILYIFALHSLRECKKMMYSEPNKTERHIFELFGLTNKNLQILSPIKTLAFCTWAMQYVKTFKNLQICNWAMQSHVNSSTSIFVLWFILVFFFLTFFHRLSFLSSFLCLLS